MQVNSSKDIYDVIVIGVGSMGSATLYELAKRGLNVLGLEQFSIVHENGSHYGQSRVIRKAYFEHPNYVPLLHRAYDLWDQMEQVSNEKLVHKIGLASFGQITHPAISGTLKSSELYDIPVQKIRPDQFRPFQIPSHFQCLFEEEAGYVEPEKAIRVFAEQAMHKGADLKEQVHVKSWNLHEGYVEVITDRQVYKAKKIVCTGGGFVSQLVPRLREYLTVTRQLIAWIKPKKGMDVSPQSMPCWFIADDELGGMFYGFPKLSEQGLKIGLHFPGEEIEPHNLHNFDAESEKERIKQFMEVYMPGVFDSFLSVKPCIYTYSPDGDFIIDYLPKSENRVLIAAGFSGHGFKFAPIVGDVLADLVEKGSSEQLVDFLKLRRFGE